EREIQTHGGDCPLQNFAWNCSETIEVRMDRPFKQIWRLRNDTKQPSKFAHFHSKYGIAVDSNVASANVHHTQQRLDNAGLSGAGTSDQRGLASDGQREIELVENYRRVLAIGHDVVHERNF